MASGASHEEQTVEAGAGAASSAGLLTWRDIRGTTRHRADELIAAEAEAASLEALRVATGETDGGMERHTVRQCLIAERGDARDHPDPLAADAAGQFRPPAPGRSDA